MPSPVAQTSKQAARQDLARRTTGMVRGTTTGAGTNATAVDSGMAGFGDDYFNDRYILLTSGTYSGHYRPISDYTSSSGTFTWLRVLAGGSGSGVTYEVYPFDPTWYTQALREACQFVRLRPVRWSFSPWTPDDNGQTPHTFSMPSSLERLRALRVDIHGTEEVDDEFNRANSSGGPGGDWTAGVGTWGISSNKLYSVSDADLDVVVQSSNPYLYNGWMQAVVEGTMESATDFRTPSLVFRYLDATNFLTVGLVTVGSTESVILTRLNNGSAPASPIASAAVALTNGSQYEVTVRWVGQKVEVWVDGVQYLDVTLSETERKYENGGNVGMYLAKAGSPGTNARVDRFRAHQVTDTMSVPLWSYEKPILRLERGYNPSYLLHAEGEAPFTQPALDTTDGQLTSDSTSVIECSITDPTWELIMLYAEAALYDIAAHPGNMPSEQERAKYRELANARFDRAERAYGRFRPQRQPLSLTGYRY